MNAKRILIVEDDRVTQKLIADALRSAGYEVATAQDGATAVKIARELEPDLITLDVQLAKNSPDDSWDGFSVAAWLRRLSQGKPMPLIIVISGLEPAKIIENAAAVGAYTFLPKPFAKQVLLDLVAEALRSNVNASPVQPPEGPQE
jgi:two-component system OmpR family response regulator